MQEMEKFFNNLFSFAQDNITRIGQMAVDLRPEMDAEIQNIEWRYHLLMDELIGEEMTLSQLEIRINSIIKEFGEKLDELLGT